MERSGSSAPAVHDHADLARLLQRGGPYVTVWASRPDVVPKAIASRVQEVRDSLGDGVPDTVIEELAARVESAFPEHAGVVAIADREQVVLVEPLPEAPRSDAIVVGQVPALAPVLEHRQATIPFAVVIADRRGADIHWSEPRPAGRAREGSATVESDTEDIRKVRGTGWSHRRIQQRAENAWEHTADQIAEELMQHVDVIGPRMIAVGGDVRMVQLLRDKLPAAASALVRELPGSRSADGSDEHREAELRRWVRTAIAEDTVATLRLFDQERGQRDRAAEGVEDTFAAIREARVDVLLVHETGPDAEGGAGQAWFVPDEPHLVAVDDTTLRDLNRDGALRGRTVDVAIRAAILTGAGIRIVPDTPRLTDGIGAILRW